MPISDIIYVENIRQIARDEAERVLRMRLEPRYGTVVEWDPKAHAARVTYQPEGKLSDWLPVATHWIGNGWGMVAALNVGDQVKVMAPEYGSNQYQIVGRLFDQRNPPPQGVQQGEFWLVDPNGSFIKFQASKNQLNINSSQLLNITATNEVTVNAPKVTLAGGGPAVARVGDTVICPAGTGHITSGSGITNSG